MEPRVVPSRFAIRLRFRDRAQYPAFASYMPQVAQFYRDLPPRLAAKMATFDAKSAHVR
jgi:hypothetical protein